ncbi:MAG: Hsp20/alpha crystallin family protein [Bacteroidota bacterium]
METTISNLNHQAMNRNKQLNSFFDDFLMKDLFHWTNKGLNHSNFTPSVNILSNNDHYDLQVLAPGMVKSDFKIEVDQNKLIISAEVSNKTDNQESNFIRKEFNYFSFKRSFALPKEQIDLEKISATYTDGILKINIPKIEKQEVPSAKQITIN